MQSKKIGYSANYKYYVFIAFIIISFSVIILKLFLSPIYGDEGWFYCAAQAKNQLGYYAFPPYYDIPAFQESLSKGGLSLNVIIF